jgi:hypothetical protein
LGATTISSLQPPQIAHNLQTELYAAMVAQNFQAELDAMIAQMTQNFQITQNEMFYHEADVVELTKLTCNSHREMQCLECITADPLLLMLQRQVKEGVEAGTRIFFVPHNTSLNIVTIFTELAHPQNSSDIVNCRPFLVQAFTEIVQNQAPNL